MGRQRLWMMRASDRKDWPWDYQRAKAGGCSLTMRAQIEKGLQRARIDRRAGQTPKARTD